LTGRSFLAKPQQKQIGLTLKWWVNPILVLHAGQ
jgi:hypothetical protein